MNNVNKTLYIPLYGKSYVSRKNVILQDKKAEAIWEQEGFVLRGKSASKWLAYYMAMRAAVYDEWVKRQIENSRNCVVLHVGCGMDSRVERVNAKDITWYDIDFPEVICERRKYYTETELYHMLSADMREGEWKKEIAGSQSAIILMEGVSMYFKPEELAKISGLVFEKTHCMTPQEYIDELHGLEKSIFKYLYAGKIAEDTYKMYEFRKM